MQSGLLLHVAFILRRGKLCLVWFLELFVSFLSLISLARGAYVRLSPTIPRVTASAAHLLTIPLPRCLLISLFRLVDLFYFHHLLDSSFRLLYLARPMGPR
jgi:hypothetical protein